jgi:aminoglycoside phosphotransferase (APT) family kinase protein
MGKDHSSGLQNMTESFDQLVQKVDSHGNLLRAWRLTGGVSAQVTALEVGYADGSVKKWIARQHGEADRQQNPQIAEDEFRLLRSLKTAGLPVPAPLYVDHDLFPHPVIVSEFIDGTTEMHRSQLPEFAAHLAAIHRIDKRNFPHLPLQTDIYTGEIRNRPTELDESLDEGRIRDALEAAGTLPEMNESVLLHGDYWQGNVLWRDERLVGIIDWEDAKMGDPLADIANTRLEMLWAFGIEGMQEFTHCYQRLMPHVDLTYLPCWDLYTALRPAHRLSEWAGGDEQREQKMREGHHLFVAQAFANLPGGQSSL